MNWINRLYETYEACKSMVGQVSGENEVPLLPICHTTQKAQIEITIDGDGKFLKAKVVSKEEARTIIPSTESSGGRTSGTSPHPLCDKLQYVALDYTKFGGEKQQCFRPDSDCFTIKNIVNEYFQNEFENSAFVGKLIVDKNKKVLDILNHLVIQNNLTEIIGKKDIMLSEHPKKINDMHIISNKYLLLDIFPLTLQKILTYEYLLTKWCESDFSNNKAKAVLKYVKKGEVIRDLVKYKILIVGEKNLLIKKWDGDAKEKPVIFNLFQNEQWQADAFIRWRIEILNDPQEAVWLDRELWESWKSFYIQTKQNKALCYVTGNYSQTADQHPAKIRNDGDKAKIISSNDNSGFTFRGRFLDADQAEGVGFEVTQKAHSALRWLIARQGYRKGDQAIVAWAVTGSDIPDPFADPMAYIGDDLPSIESNNSFTAQEFALKLKKKIAGYNKNLGNTNYVVIMGLDSATPGRLAITFYRELTGSDFLRRLDTWHEKCAWFHDYAAKEMEDNKTGKLKKFHFRFTGAPSPDDIAQAAYGTRLDDKLRKATVERLLQCIIDGRQVPHDLVETLKNRASNRIGLDNWEWRKVLSIACALYRKYFDKGGFEMALEERRKSRDYLYGRLLALADSLEYWALSKASENRPTTAARLMQRFADHPYTTWRSIELSLGPYKARLGGKSINRQRLIDEVKNMFESADDFTNDKPLSGEFLLAFSCQKEKLREDKLLYKNKIEEMKAKGQEIQGEDDDELENF